MKKFTAALLCILMLLSAISMASCNIGKKPEETPQNSETPAIDVDANKVVMSTTNFSFTFAEFNFIFVQQYQSFLQNAYNQYGDSYTQALKQIYNFDTTLSTKDQLMYDNSGTYFNYFLDAAKLMATDILIFCELAKANGFELTEDDRSSIESDIEYYASGAAQNNITFAQALNDKMGLTTEEVFRSYSEKNYLAWKAYDDMTSKYSHTEEEINEEFLSSPKDYAYVSYLAYTFQKSETVSAETAKKSAEELAATTDPEAFKSYVENYHNTVLYAGKEDFPSFSASSLEKKNVSYAEGTKYLDWMFGDTAAVNGTFTDSDDTNGIYTVFMLLKAPSENEYYTKNVRHILFLASEYESTDACKKAAEEIYEIYKKNPTEENFAALAKEYTDDTASAESGGLYEDVDYNKMVADFENWCFDESRTAGDTDIILTSYGYHIMYFVGNGKYIANGHEKALTALETIDYDADHKKLVETYPITSDEDYMQNIDA